MGNRYTDCLRDMAAMMAAVRGSSDSHGYCVSSDWSDSDAAVSNDVERIVMTCSIP